MLQLSGDGTIGGLQVGGLPNATVTQAEMAANVSTTGPVFSVYQSAPQAIPANTFTKLLFNTEEFDIGGCFDTGTSRFQPTVAGYYQISGAASALNFLCTIIASIYKSTGGAAVAAKQGVTISNHAASTSVSALVYLNGSTDYVELWVNIDVAQNINIGAPFTYFQGYLARAA